MEVGGVIGNPQRSMSGPLGLAHPEEQNLCWRVVVRTTEISAIIQTSFFYIIAPVSRLFEFYRIAYDPDHSNLPWSPGVLVLMVSSQF